MGPHQCQSDRPARLLSKFAPALALLLDSAMYAAQTSGDRWEFAVDMGQLKSLGLSDNDLRYLVRLSCLDHASEMTVVGNNGRQFQRTGDLFFTERTCFVLTPQALSAALGHVEKTPASHPAHSTTIRIVNGAEDDGALHVPDWDVERRILSIEGQTIKQFRCRAANQETILSAYQEEGWPVRIDDPLVPVETLDIKRRLNETIKSLNRSHSSRLIRFRGDGTGEGIVWEPAMPVSSSGALSEI
jgi:hypothetical protein